MDENERGLYYREIAAAFLKHRGAPFFLSAKDLALVAAWERAGIPLASVLEGIESAFDSTRPHARPRGKVLSLAYCEVPVARAWESHRDRRVGGTRKLAPPRDRRTAVRAEIARFLSAVPPGFEAVGAVFADAAAGLDAGNLSDDDLERLDDKVEALLRAATPAGDAAAVRETVRAEHRKLARADVEAAAAVELVKSLRARHRIPYLSPFYYG
jgi:hypothetical protein